MDFLASRASVALGHVNYFDHYLRDFPDLSLDIDLSSLVRTGENLVFVFFSELSLSLFLPAIYAAPLPARRGRALRHPVLGALVCIQATRGECRLCGPAANGHRALLAPGSCRVSLQALPRFGFQKVRGERVRDCRLVLTHYSPPWQCGAHGRVC